MKYLIPKNFNKTVTAAGTAERLTSQNIRVPSVFIQAEVTNTAQIFVGDALVSSANCGIELDSGDSITLSAVDFGWADRNISLMDIWLDTTVNGDGVWVMYMQEVDSDTFTDYGTDED